jgi:hypothetical protein
VTRGFISVVTEIPYHGHSIVTLRNYIPSASWGRVEKANILTPNNEILRHIRNKIISGMHIRLQAENLEIMFILTKIFVFWFVTACNLVDDHECRIDV